MTDKLEVSVSQQEIDEEIDGTLRKGVIEEFNECIVYKIQKD